MLWSLNEDPAASAGGFLKPWGRSLPGMKTWPANSLRFSFPISSQGIIFWDFEPLQRGALWAVGAGGPDLPRPAPIPGGREFPPPFLESKDSGVRGLAAWGLGSAGGWEKPSRTGPTSIRRRGHPTLPGRDDSVVAASADWRKKPSRQFGKAGLREGPQERAEGEKDDLGEIRRPWEMGSEGVLGVILLIRPPRGAEGSWTLTEVEGHIPPTSSAASALPGRPGSEGESPEPFLITSSTETPSFQLYLPAGGRVLMDGQEIILAMHATAGRKKRPAGISVLEG